MSDRKKILQELGFSEQFIQMIENENQYGENVIPASQQNYKDVSIAAPKDSNNAVIASSVKPSDTVFNRSEQKVT